MIELKLNVSDVDYDAVIRKLGGSEMTGNTFSMLTMLLSDSAKEEFAVSYINSNAKNLEAMLEEAAAQQGIRLQISGAQATIVDQE